MRPIAGLVDKKLAMSVFIGGTFGMSKPRLRVWHHMAKRNPQQNQLGISFFSSAGRHRQAPGPVTTAARVRRLNSSHEVAMQQYNAVVRRMAGFVASSGYPLSESVT